LLRPRKIIRCEAFAFGGIEMFNFVHDVFATTVTKRMAHEEALMAIRTYGSGAVDHLEMRMRRTGSKQRRQVYRIAKALVPTLTGQ